MSVPAFRNMLRHKTTVFTVCTKWLSTKPNLTIKKLDSNLVLRTLDPVNNETRPLVILFSWMMAKDRHIAKYGNLYASEGFDVLSIKVKPMEVLRPKRAQGVISKVLGVLDDRAQKGKPLLIHGFSVGGYVCGEMLLKLEREGERYANIRKRMQGQIFDSPVDFEGVPRGFANVLANNRLAKSLIQATIEGYLKLFESTVTKHYIRSSQAFHSNSLRLPSLMLYSRADPIGVDKNIEAVVDKWRYQGNSVKTKCWENTPHVSHFHHHPDEYVEAILDFLESVGLSRSEMQKDDRVKVKI